MVFHHVMETRTGHIKKKSKIQTLLLRLVRADLVFWILPLLMVVLVIGTLAQAEMGLFLAQQRYFASWIIWFGYLPFPGGHLLIGLFTLHLFLKFIVASEWRWVKAGIILSHAGALILLVGGLLTALLAREYYMVIPEGQTSPFLYDYHARELMIFEDDRMVGAIPFEQLQIGDVPLDKSFELSVMQRCTNCLIERREDSAQDFGDAPLHSMAAFMALDSTAPVREAEANISGVTLQISGSDTDGIYLAFEAMPKPVEFQAGGQAYKILLGKRQTRLPFAIELVDFKKESYPGEVMARAYSADVIVHDGGLNWPAHIAMNKPLRYQGYTFYQSAFERNEQGEITILAVVENKGRLFPYIGTIVITIGLLLHLILVLRRKEQT